MNESLQFSKLASRLYASLADIACELSIEDDAIYARSIEAILNAFEAVDAIVSLREPEEPDGTEAEHKPEAPDTIN